MHKEACGCILRVGIVSGKGPGPMDGELRLQISEEGADAERLAVLAGDVWAELLQLDVKDVTAPQIGEAPPGPGWSVRPLWVPCRSLLASPLRAWARWCL